MNLPPPFEKDAIPGLFSPNQSASYPNYNHGKKRRRTSGKSSMQIIEEEEGDGLEEENENVDELDPVSENPSESIDTHSLLQLLSNNNDAKADINISHRTRHELIGKPLTRPSKCLPILNSDALSPAFQLDGGLSCSDKAFRLSRTGVISESENFRKARLTISKWTFQDLESEQMPEAQLAFEKAMKNYQQGESSNTLYVKNLSKSVNIEDLFAVLELSCHLSLDSNTAQTVFFQILKSVD
ncbi:hypothetical protein PsorP6_012882 [Peronosclerospora sorghi]|uniref:Uncharacterized protein n=1 Tax=Peronosclerospora sorghi TaxID=230839 RepID=A0ACC0WIF3_9STRA|nr:hypothetical protein PsorP6_012882 [Peronosclerospora sorghi]